METKEYRTIDKRAEWAERGEWDDEPDKMQWPDPETGLPCLIVRGPSGALCGYVGVPDTHPWHGKDYSELPDYGPEVHGGLTFASACQHTDDETQHICHVPGPGEPDNVWWFGFDCAHSGDVMPKYLKEYGGPFGRTDWEQYRNIGYVRGQVTHLAQQLAAVA